MFTGSRRKHHLKAEASQKVTGKCAQAARKEQVDSISHGMDSPNTKISSGNRSLVFVHKFSAKRIITCQGTNENTGISLTKREFRLQKGNLAYKTGFSFTKRESCVTNGTLGLLFTYTY